MFEKFGHLIGSSRRNLAHLVVRRAELCFSACHSSSTTNLFTSLVLNEPFPPCGCSDAGLTPQRQLATASYTEPSSRTRACTSST
jgi:hypothetical protein